MREMDGRDFMGGRYVFIHSSWAFLTYMIIVIDCDSGCAVSTCSMHVNVVTVTVLDRHHAAVVVMAVPAPVHLRDAVVEERTVPSTVCLLKTWHRM